MQDITVLIVTFARPVEIRQTIYGFLKHVKYPRELLHFHLADNDTANRKGIKDYISTIQSDFPYLHWTYTNEKKPGWGNNVNTALKYIKNDLIFLIEDDRQAYHTIDLEQGATLLEGINNLGIIRYDGIAGHTNTVLRIKDYKRVHYAEIDTKLSERPITYSNQPHLRHRRFTEFYGYYPENCKLGVTEQLYARHIKRNPDGPKIAILADGIQNRFNHLCAGKSYQHTKDDR